MKPWLTKLQEIQAQLRELRMNQAGQEEIPEEPQEEEAWATPPIIPRPVLPQLRRIHPTPL